jgi:hypothetical protein
MCTTVLAVIVGLIVVNVMKPGVNKDLETAKAKVEAATGSDKDVAISELEALKEKIKAKVEEKNEANEEAAEAVEENDRKNGVYLEKAKKKLKHAESVLKRAQKAQEGSPNDEFLKEDMVIATMNLTEAQDAVKMEEHFMANHKEKTIGDILENMLKMLVTDNLYSILGFSKIHCGNHHIFFQKLIIWRSFLSFLRSFEN